jgi:hypothetical protein
LSRIFPTAGLQIFPFFLQFFFFSVEHLLIYMLMSKLFITDCQIIFTTPTSDGEKKLFVFLRSEVFFVHASQPHVFVLLLFYGPRTASFSSDIVYQDLWSIQCFYIKDKISRDW